MIARASSSTASSSTARRNRWAVSFADLLLLLLGFFILLQASGQRRDAMLAEVSEQFGGRAMSQAVVELSAAELFAPGEAMLTAQGRARLLDAAQPFVRARSVVTLHSRGMDPARQRFDDWDLAAARLGAVARALKENGIADHRLTISGLDQAATNRAGGQHIRISADRSGAAR